MTSHHGTHPQAEDLKLRQLIAHALRFTKRNNSRERKLAADIVSRTAELDRVRLQTSRNHTPDAPPDEVIEALSAPPGTQVLLVTYAHGAMIKALINPIGGRSPEREEAVWRCLREQVTQTSKGRGH